MFTRAINLTLILNLFKGQGSKFNPAARADCFGYGYFPVTLAMTRFQVPGSDHRNDAHRKQKSPAISDGTFRFFAEGFRLYFKIILLQP